MKIEKELFKLQDKKYLDFNSKLIPNIDKNKFIGVRIPDIRKLAKSYIKDDESKIFLNDLPHKYHEENLLHGILLSEIKDYDLCIKYLDKFLPYVTNWAVCDTILPNIFKKNTDRLLEKIKIWIKSNDTYTTRFGISMLMRHYLDQNFKKEYLEIVSNIKSNEYYINMMISWYYATALAKQWEHTIVYLEKNKLDTWVHNKTIQKAIESYRITDSQKEYLKKLKK